MKRAFHVTMLTALLAVAASGAFAAESDPWFDMANCAFCKHLTTDPELLPNLGWEHYPIENGMVSITTFKTEHAKKAFAEASARMEAAGKEMQAGKQMPMCNFCQSMTKIFMTGEAQYEEVNGENVHLMLITSGNPEVVEQIHAHCQHTNEAMAKLAAKE